MTDFRPIYDWAKKELGAELQRHEGRKKDIILEAATRLEKSGMDKNKVGAALGNELEKAKLATKRYVRKILDEEWKQTEKANISIKHKKDAELVPHNTLNESINNDAEEIIISNEGKPVTKEEKDIFSIIDWKRFKEAEDKGMFKPDPKKIPGAQYVEEEEDTTDYKKAYNHLYLKLAPFKARTILTHNGIVVPLVVEVTPATQQVTVMIDERSVKQ